MNNCGTIAAKHPEADDQHTDDEGRALDQYTELLTSNLFAGGIAGTGRLDCRGLLLSDLCGGDIGVGRRVGWFVDRSVISRLRSLDLLRGFIHATMRSAVNVAIM